MMLKTLWERLIYVLKTNASLTIIVVAALLLELTTGVMYYSAQNIIQLTMERLVEREMNAIYLNIRNHLAKVEVTLDNMAWIVTDDLPTPDSLFRATRQLVENNTDILGSSISCIPNYYPQEGRWFEPYSVRRADGSIETIQLGSESHDYTKSEFFRVPIAKGEGHWCEPYLDSDGAKATVTTYGVPVRDGTGKIVAVVDADISIDWLDGVMNELKVYKSTQRFLVTGSYNLLVGEDCPLYRAALEQIKADSDRQGYFTIEGEDGGKRHVFFTPVGGRTDWVLINVLDDSDVFGKLRMRRRALLLMVFAGLFIVGFIVWRASRNLERLRRVNAEKEMIGSELKVASEIQQSMLPQRHLKRGDVDICGSLVPAREVGGDLFDYFISDGRLFFCIGDVSGKGVPAAMVMAVVHTLFRSACARESNPARVMEEINRATCKGNDTAMFVTLFIGVLDLATGCLRYCNAGHDAPFVIGKDYKLLPIDANLPVGVFDDMEYGVQEILLPPGSSLFLYTDGLTEAMDSRHELFRIESVEKVVGECARQQLTPEQILEANSREVHLFVGDAEQSDDLTMLAIRYR